MYNRGNEQTLDEMNNFICKDTKERGTSSYSRKLRVYLNQTCTMSHIFVN